MGDRTMAAMGSSAETGEMGREWLPGFLASVALARSAEGWPMALVLRDTDDTEDSDEEEEDDEDEEEYEEFDEDEEELDSDVLRTAEPNAVHGHGKTSREEIEEELEEMESEDEAADADAGEEEAEKDRKRAMVDRAMDSALRMSAGAELRRSLLSR